MRIAKPLLLTSTPVGVVWGLYEAWTIDRRLGLLMLALIGVISAFTVMTVRRIRRER